MARWYDGPVPMQPNQIQVRGERPVEWHGDDFDKHAERAREAAGYKDHENWDNTWSRLIRGQNTGRRVAINFQTATSATAAQASSQELLRVNPKDDRFAQQICLTLSPPQIINSLVTDPIVIPGGTQDNIQMSNTLGGVGGKTIGANALDFFFSNPIVSVFWGTGSIENRVECDIANGLCLNLVTSFVRVIGSVEGAPYSTMDGAYVLGATIGPGYPRQNNAQRTIAVGGLANTVSSSVFCVPRYARSVRVVASDGSNAPPLSAATISFWRSSGGSADAKGVGDFFCAGNNPVPIPVPNGAYFFSIVGGYAASGGGFVAPQYSAIFDLAI